MVLGLESTAARMARIARCDPFRRALLSLDEMLARVEAVTLDDVAELAAELYDPAGLAAACIGPTRTASAPPRPVSALALAA